MDNDQRDDSDMDDDQADYKDGELSRAERIVETLETEIKEGRLRERAKLPSERDLADSFKVSRMTVRKALQTLVGGGLIVSHPSRGYFVASIRERLQERHGELIHTNPESLSITAEELRQFGSFVEYMKRLKRNPEVTFLEKPSLVAADAEVAEHLQLNPNELVFRRYRLQLADKLPYRLIESYYPADLFGELLTTVIGDKPLFTWLQERYGLTVVHAQEVLKARLATTSERNILRISPGMPIVALDRTVWADNGRPVEWAHIIASAELYTFTYEYDILT